MVFLKCLPRNCDQLKAQTSLSTVTDKEFTDTFEPTVFSACDRVIQVLLFIFGLGWLRIMLSVVILLVYVLMMTPVTIFAQYPSIIRFFYAYGTYVSQVTIRSITFLFGILYISKEGTPEKDTRGFLFNHTSMLDGPLLFLLKPYTMIAMSGIKGIPIFGQIATANGCQFIDRTKSQGNSSVIKSIMEDHSKLPISIAPEGKISNGDIVFKFRTGSFLTKEPIQPVAVRYSWLMPWGGATYNWIVDGFFEWLWLAFCIPFGHVRVTYLPQITPEQQEGKNPNEIAEMCQLIIANHLGTLAIDRTSKEIFQKSSMHHSTSETSLVQDDTLAKTV